MLKLGLTWARAMWYEALTIWTQIGQEELGASTASHRFPPPFPEAGRLPFWKTQRENSLKARRDLGW